MVAKKLPLSASVRRASELVTPSVRLRSQDLMIDARLDGGLLFGCVSEWGMPAALGRETIVKFISSATRGLGLDGPLHCLWIASSKAELIVYPPAWAARGVDLHHLRFTVSAAPVNDLKPIFLSSCFKVIVLDSPDRLSGDDVAFIAAQARVHQVAVLILRPYMLSDRRPCVWTRPRINCFVEDGKLQIHFIRGLSASPGVEE